MRDTTPDAVCGNELEQLASELHRVAEASAATHPQASDAALALITAVNHDDDALMDSSRASLLAALAELASEVVDRELGASANTKAGLKEGWQKYIDKKAYEIAVFEAIRDKIESIIDERIASMLKARRLVNSFKVLEHEVENAQALEEGIRDLRTFREDLLKGWPSRKPPSPIDQTAITKAREAIARGEKGMNKDELVWGNKRSEKAV